MSFNKHDINKDRMTPVVSGVGFMGVGHYVASVKGKRTKQYSRWINMLKRCYSEYVLKDQPSYVGCEVAPIWHNFQNFAKWFDDNHPKDGKKYQLDKDILGDGKIYSPNTCVFISQSDNLSVRYGNLGKVWRMKSPKGVVYEFTDQGKFAKEHGLHKASISKIVTRYQVTHRGWTIA